MTAERFSRCQRAPETSRRERTEPQPQFSPEKDLKHTQSQKADARRRPCAPVAPGNRNKPRVILLTLAVFGDKTMKTSELRENDSNRRKLSQFGLIVIAATRCHPSI